MIDFGDHLDTNGVLINLIKESKLKYFELFWTSINPTEDTLSFIETENKESRINYFGEKDPTDTALFNIICNENQAINNYLATQYQDLYSKSISKYVEEYGKDSHYRYFFEKLTKKNPKNTRIFISTLAKLSPKYISEILQFEHSGHPKATFVTHVFMAEKASKEKLLLVNHPDITDAQKQVFFGPNSATYRRCPDQEVIVGILRYFAGDKDKFYEYVSDGKLNKICQSAGKSATESLRVVLFESALDEETKFKLLMTGSNSKYPTRDQPFWYTVKAGNFDKSLLILKYYKKDKEKLLSLLNQGEYEPVLSMISKSEDPNASMVLKFFLHGTDFSYDEKFKMFKNAKNPLITLNKNNLLEILNYFDPERKRQNKLKTWLSTYSFRRNAIGKDDRTDDHINDEVMIELLKYFRTEKAFLVDLLCTKSGTYGSFIFSMFTHIVQRSILQSGTRMDGSLKYIMEGIEWQSGELKKIICNTPYKEPKPEEMIDSFIEILKVIKNDRKLFMGALKVNVSHRYKSKAIVWDKICDQKYSWMFKVFLSVFLSFFVLRYF